MIAIVDYGVGNLASVSRALTAVGARAAVVRDPSLLARARGIILPGVGAFAPAARQLRRSGFVDPLRSALTAGVPLLGICLGLQLLFAASAEAPAAQSGLGWLRGTVERFPPGPKVPHIGWNEAIATGNSPLWSGLSRAWFYFVHSYYPVPHDPSITAAWTEYGIRFASAVECQNLFGVQFHPEKSGRAGLHLLSNFVRTCKEGC